MKYHKLSSKRTYFYRYMLSFLIILFIPLSLLSFLIRAEFFDALQGEILKNNLTQLEDISTSFENDLDRMEQIVSQIMLTPAFYEEKQPASISSLLECIHMLNVYRSSANSFESIAIRWENLPYVYSNSGSCPLRLLDDRDPMAADFSTSHHLTISQAACNPLVSHNADLILYTYPVNFSSSLPEARIMFLVNGSRYHGRSRFVDTKDPTVYYVFYGEQIITSNSDNLPFDSQKLQSLLEYSAPFSEVIYHKEEPLLLCADASRHPGFLFLSLTPLSYAMSLSNQLQREFLIYIIACLVTAAAVIYVSLWLNYRPLHRLFRSVEHLLQNSQKDLNEISSIRLAIQNLEYSNASLLTGSQQAASQLILKKLLAGSYSPDSPIPLKELDSYGTTLNQPWFLIGILKLHVREEIALSPTDLLSVIHCYFPQSLVGEISASAVTLLINLPEITDTLPGRLEKLRNALCQSLQCPVTLSIGNPYPDIYKCSTSYMEAIYSLDYRFILGNDSLILASEVNLEEEWSETYPHQELARLKSLLKTRQLSTLDQITAQFNLILDYIRTCEIPLFAARRICFDIINIVLSSMSDEELQNNKSYLTHLACFDTLDDLLSSLSTICHNLFAFSEPESAGQPQELINRMKQYVDSNYTDANFSLQEMADYFDMGMANLSQYFKRKTGRTLIDYYTELRMELARQLLSERRYKLDEIAAKTGYLNTSSFIRRFRQYYGTSPGQYSQTLNTGK
jgi:two-component system response regulator YesN